MTILDGKVIAKAIESELLDSINSYLVRDKRPPHIVAVLIGENPASETYVKAKVKAAHRVGMQASVLKYTEDVTQTTIEGLLHQLNHDQTVDGVIIQLPLPKHLNTQRIIEVISPSKDVDGFHPLNVGRMMLGMEALLPATPSGVIELLKRYKIETKGLHAVVIGRSHIVGQPMAQLLSRNATPGNCTVTICHSYTPNLAQHLRHADLVVAAAGVPNLVTADMIKPGAIVIDVGIHRTPDDSNAKGYSLCGDVCYLEMVEKVKAITPVPGGVGPMTIAMLLKNTFIAYERNYLSHRIV